MAEDVAPILSPPEEFWKKKFESLQTEYHRISRLYDQAVSTIQETSQDTPPTATGDDDDDEAEAGNSNNNSSNESPTSKTRRKQRKRLFFCILGVVMVVTLLLSVSVATVFLFRDSGEDNNNSNPLVSTPRFVSPEERARAIYSLLNNRTLSNRTLQFPYNNNNTPYSAAQHPSDQALLWLLRDDPLQLDATRSEAERHHILQRFALLTFIFGQGNDPALLQGPDYEHECDPSKFPIWRLLWECNNAGGVSTEIRASTSTAISTKATE